MKKLLILLVIFMFIIAIGCAGNVAGPDTNQSSGQNTMQKPPAPEDPPPPGDPDDIIDGNRGGG
jgi:hypothetical protein